jgi:hypothetical protein
MPVNHSSLLPVLSQAGDGPARMFGRLDELRKWPCRRFVFPRPYGHNGPMPVLHIEHRIADLDTWLQDFASRAPAREEAGVTAVSVLQADDDPHYIVELVFFDTVGAAQDYQTFMREQVWLSSTPGLASDPHARILHEVETASRA